MTFYDFFHTYYTMTFFSTYYNMTFLTYDTMTFFNFFLDKLYYDFFWIFSTYTAHFSFNILGWTQSIKMYPMLNSDLTHYPTEIWAYFVILFIIFSQLKSALSVVRATFSNTNQKDILFYHLKKIKFLIYFPHFNCFRVKKQKTNSYSFFFFLWMKDWYVRNLFLPGYLPFKSLVVGFQRLSMFTKISISQPSNHVAVTETRFK